MNVSEIRQAFIDYFASKGHTPVASSSLVPGDDPTLLFTNAGMNQFKDVFLGLDKRSYVRATSSQRCVRAGGKHNDLENVGYTARHHTFFEMLGNFSFGDYFKHDAIKYAWELLTEIYKLPKEKLWVTVYGDDDEAFNIWANEIGVPVERIVRIGDNKGTRYASDNFWMMGDTGPCGPCSEIFYDHGPHIAGGPPGSAEQDGDRYIEIWNLVFMQYNREVADGPMVPLPKPSVDTGMGLERLSAILQHVHSNYEIDLFQSLIEAAARETGEKNLENPSLRVIADHIRACSFLICDGVIPSSDGRGYVLRRIARRAMRHGHKLGQSQPFFYKLVNDLALVMGDAFPEIREAKDRVIATLKAEEERFGETLENGMQILEAAIAKNKTLDGETAFKLYDTFGFPIDLTADIGRERGFEIDMAGFESAMKAQQERSRAGSKFTMKQALEYTGASTDFKGYETLQATGTVLALYHEGAPVQSLNAGQAGVVVLDKTPFYAESGGQVGDQGLLSSTTTIFTVQDTQKIQATVFGHHGVIASGTLKVGDSVSAQVNITLRQRTMRHHSVTHIMHKALHEVLGSHVQQKGSLVDADKTRFDFSHNSPMGAPEIARVEEIVNAEILVNVATQARVMAIEDAQKTGAMMLFGEKYGDEVRVLDIGTSRELCGGTHVARTGDIGLFKIVAESGVAAGVRRIEAVAGSVAFDYVQALDRKLNQAASLLKSQPTEVDAKISALIDNVKLLEKQLAQIKSKMAASQGDELSGQAEDVKGSTQSAKVLAVILPGADVKTLRETLDKLRDKLKSAAIVLASTEGGKVSLIAGVTPDLTAKVKAGELVNMVALQVGGKGGGRPDMAQAGGTDVTAVPAALASVKAWVAERL